MRRWETQSNDIETCKQPIKIVLTNEDMEGVAQGMRKSDDLQSEIIGLDGNCVNVAYSNVDQERLSISWLTPSGSYLMPDEKVEFISSAFGEGWSEETNPLSFVRHFIRASAL